MEATETQSDTETQRDRETQKHTARHRETQSYTEAHSKTQRDTEEGAHRDTARHRKAQTLCEGGPWGESLGEVVLSLYLGESSLGEGQSALERTTNTQDTAGHREAE